MNIKDFVVVQHIAGEGLPMIWTKKDWESHFNWSKEHNRVVQYKILATFSKDSPYQGSAGVWRSDQAPELVDGKKAIPRHVIAEKKTHDGKTYKSKRVAYYFPERFKSVEFEDWDDYDPKDFPYTTQDEEKGVVWLKAGWYESVNCDRCDEYWSAPLDVIEWLDESIASPAGDGWTPLTSGNPLPDYDEPMLWITESGNQFVQALDKDESIQCFRDATKATHYRPLPSPPNKSV